MNKEPIFGGDGLGSGDSERAVSQFVVREEDVAFDWGPVPASRDESRE